jgi:hypothetical protein
VDALAGRGWQALADDMSVVFHEENAWWQLVLPFRSRPRTADWRPAPVRSRPLARPGKWARATAFIILRRLGQENAHHVAVRRLTGGEAFRAMLSQSMDAEHLSREMIERSLEFSADVEVYEIGFFADSSRFDAFIERAEQLIRERLTS